MVKVWDIYRRLPYFIQDFVVTAYNVRSYFYRRRGRYHELKDYYSSAWFFTEEEWGGESEARLVDFIRNACSQSEWYAPYAGCDFSDFPVLEKSDLVTSLDRLKTIDIKDGVVSLTGGTTGASMKVVYTHRDVQERFAILDSFRSYYGYDLGEKVAWFSGKNIATSFDVGKGRCYRDDLVNKIRFFSTFHINEKNFQSYWDALCDFSPRFIVGFPSSVYEICEIARRKGLKIPKPVSVFFPTAEVVLPSHRELIGDVLGCRLVDQYASSEGAPFIFECESGGLHLHPLTGVFEVVDDDMTPADEGEVLVTSFTTSGVPLIRYRIGDRIELAPDGCSCDCGCSFPLVKKIDGRSSDYVLSPENGRVNLGNISNSTKDVRGIVSFQIIQESLHSITVSVVCSDLFDESERLKFISALKERLGNVMSIEINMVDEIPREKSGKFRIVKNRLSI